MCDQCNYPEMLTRAELAVTNNRLDVLEAIGNNTFPLSPGDIYRILHRSSSINRVTIYRILDLLVKHKLVERLSTGGRSFYYGLAPNDHHQRHPHFYCKKCGQMNCLNPNSITIDSMALEKMFPGRIDNVEVRVDGICKNCMR